MCVYGGDDAEHFNEALESVYNQTLRPNEVVLVVDGPVPKAVDAVVARFVKEENLQVYRLERNMGHGVARREGFARCQYDYVAVADADDVNAPDRFERQIAEFANDSQLSAVSSYTRHFVGSVDNVINDEYAPSDDAAIKRAMKTICPICQPAVMLKKSDVKRAGGYLDWYHAEDYYLWIRMALAGAKFKNIEDALVYMRTTPEQMRRRGGFRYFSSMRKLYGFMLKEKFISFPTYVFNVASRFVVQIVLPSSLRLAVRKIVQRRGA